MGLAALGAGGRRFESFCPDLKIKGLQAIITPIFDSNFQYLPMICPWISDGDDDISPAF